MSNYFIKTNIFIYIQKINSIFLEQHNSKSIINLGLKDLDKNFIAPKINYTPNGKPYFDNLDLKFNVSHTNEFMVCAFSKHDIGIDLEQIKTINYEHLIPLIDKNKEKKYSLTQFFELWCTKESVLKCFGGTMNDMLDIALENKNIAIHNNNKYYLKKIDQPNNLMMIITSVHPIDDYKLIYI